MIFHSFSFHIQTEKISLMIKSHSMGCDACIAHKRNCLSFPFYAKIYVWCMFYVIAMESLLSPPHRLFLFSHDWMTLINQRQRKIFFHVNKKRAKNGFPFCRREKHNQQWHFSSSETTSTQADNFFPSTYDKKFKWMLLQPQ